jgi:phosphate acetyltransferase
LNLSLDGIRIINPETSEDLENFAERYMKMRRSKGVSEEEAIKAMKDPNYYGSMMVAMHQADGLISGTSEFSGSVLRPLFRIIKVAPNTSTASSCMIMEVDDTRFGEKGVLFFADCGVIPDPSSEQLADIAVSTANLAKHLMGIKPRVAMLSYSTKGSAGHPGIEKFKPLLIWQKKRRSPRSLTRILMEKFRWTRPWFQMSPNSNHWIHV